MEASTQDPRPNNARSDWPAGQTHDYCPGEIASLSGNTICDYWYQKSSRLNLKENLNFFSSSARVCCARPPSLPRLLESVYNSFIAPFHRLTETHFTFPFLIPDEICHTQGEKNARAYRGCRDGIVAQGQKLGVGIPSRALNFSPVCLRVRLK